jgi:TolA-binding protein
LSQLLVNTSNYKDAIEIIEGIKTKNNNLIVTYQKLTYFYALEFFQNKKYNKAKEYFIKSIQTNVDRKYTALGYFWLGECYYQLGEIENAQREYKKLCLVSEAKKTPITAWFL